MKVCLVSTILIFALGVMATATVAEQAFVEKEITAHPFEATAERATAVKAKYQRVSVGMSPTEVKAILGEPDEIRTLYESAVKNGKQTGYTYGYVIRRAVQYGSIDEKQEVLVRVSFDRNARVTNVAHWGFENDR